MATLALWFVLAFGWGTESPSTTATVGWGIEAPL